MTKLVHAAAVAAIAGTFAAVGRAQAPDVQQGKKVYDANCAKCHGGFGRGDGPEARKLGFRPRDFTLGAFKCRSTMSGQPPTDEDLLRTVTRGLPGTPMKPIEGLSDADRKAVVQYLKTLSPRAFATPATLMQFPDPPEGLAGLAGEGKALYEKMQCGQCHAPPGGATARPRRRSRTTGATRSRPTTSSRCASSSAATTIGICSGRSRPG